MATVSLQSLVDETRQAIETGAADKAVGMARHMLAHYPRLIEGWRLLGEAYLNQGQAADAAHAFEQVLAADPENVAAYYGLGLARQSLEQPEATIQAFERALEIQPNLAELRTQLLRLYAEVPGSAGQFRLSRAGLARLYARGGMYSQAVDEFRAVLDAEPERDDVKVALAEALWRDGQEDEAMDFCREILTQRPELLKPTLLLGYMLFASGDPRGEELWRRAAEQDPSLTMARTLFDILPPIRLEEPVLPEFDEAEWRAQEARRASEAPAQAGVPVAAAAAAGAATEADDLFADSWLFSTPFEEPQPHEAPAAADTAPSPPADEDEALLAALLGFGDAHAPGASSSAPESGAAAGQPARAGAQAAPTLDAIGLPDAAEIEADLKPFSLDEWDEQELPGAPSRAAAVEQEADLGDLQPFSLDEEPHTASTGAPVQRDDTANAAARERSASAAEAGEPDLGAIQPFSLEDWINEDQTPATATTASSPGEADLAGIAPFSLEDWSAEEPAGPSASDSAELSSVAPFSLDDLGLEDSSKTTSGDEEGLQGLEPFSLDEFSLDVLEEESATELSGPGAEERAAPQERKDFQWEEPAWRRQMNQQSASHAPEGESIFARMLSRRQQAGSAAPPSAPSSTSMEQEQDLFFSMDDEPLRLDWEAPAQSDVARAGSEEAASARSDQETAAWESGAAPDTTQAGDQDTASEAEPFSLADLGLEEETSTATRSGDAGVEAEPFSLADLGLEEEASTATRGGDAGVEAEPFSLADLGLEEEASTATRGGDAGVEAEPFSLADLGLEQEPPATEASASGQATPDDLEPFSLTDLGLSDEEIALTGLSDTSEAPADTASDTSFSLADLGLSDEDLALLGLTSEPQDQAAASHAESAEAATFAATTDVGHDTDWQSTTAGDGPWSAVTTGETPPEVADKTSEAMAADQAQQRSASTPEPWLEDAALHPATTAAAASAEAELASPAAAAPADEPSAQRVGPSPTQADAAIHPALAAVLGQLQAAPENDGLRLAVARMAHALQADEPSLEQYRQLIRRGQLLDDVVQDLQDMIAECDDLTTQRKLHRLLGDAFTKQNRIHEAMQAYSWTPASTA